MTISSVHSSAPLVQRRAVGKKATFGSKNTSAPSHQPSGKTPQAIHFQASLNIQGGQEPHEKFLEIMANADPGPHRTNEQDFELIKRVAKERYAMSDENIYRAFTFVEDHQSSADQQTQRFKFLHDTLIKMDLCPIPNREKVLPANVFVLHKNASGSEAVAACPAIGVPFYQCRGYNDPKPVGENMYLTRYEYSPNCDIKNYRSAVR